MRLGIAFTLLGGALWGVSGTSVQYLTTTGGAAPGLVTMLRVILGGGLFFLVLLWKQRAVVRAMFASWTNFKGMLLFGCALYANQLFYAQTVQLTNAGTATVLQMLGSVFVMLYVCLRERHLPRKREFAGLLLALVATLLIATQGDIQTLSMPPEGLFWGILTGASTGVYILVPKYCGLFDRYGSVPVVGVGMFLGIGLAVPLYFLQGQTLTLAWATLSGFGLVEWGIFVVGLVIVGTIGGYAFYLYGVSVVGSVKGSLLGAIEPVSATVIAALWLKTAFTPWDMAGMILMCAMVVFLAED